MNYLGPIQLTDAVKQSGLPLPLMHTYSNEALVLTAQIRGYRKPSKLIFAHERKLDEFHSWSNQQPLFRSLYYALHTDYRRYTIAKLAASLVNYRQKQPSGLLVLCYEDLIGIDSLEDFSDEFEQTILRAASLKHCLLEPLR